VSRVILLILFILWIAWDENLPRQLLGTLSDSDIVRYPLGPQAGAAAFLAGYVLLVLAMGLWSRLLARRVSDVNFHRSLRRFNKTMGLARAMVPAWFAVGLYLLGWHSTVETAVQTMTALPNADGSAGWQRFFDALATCKAPASIAGTLPAFLTWAALWWSEYPANRALREQNLLLQLEQDIPIHSPPRFWSYFASNLRLQLLFVLAPIVSLMILRDLVAFAWALRTGDKPPEWLELAVSVGSFAIVFLLAPVLLTRVLKTEPLPGGTLRRRLEGMCREHGLMYRDILLWHTQSNMGNAAVMGIIPRLRYVLLSDLLLETMTDEQIEAVFAHELGHIVYRHMIWYVVFLTTLLLAIGGPGGQLYDFLLPRLITHPERHEALIATLSQVMMGAGVATFFILFGFVSRRFERQADVFAARVMEGQSRRQQQQGAETPAVAAPKPADISIVGPYGAGVFASALHRVAIVNNIPIAARSWCHGSIEKRMRFLRHLGQRPTETATFDQVMSRLYVAMIIALVASATWVGVTMGREGFDRPAAATPALTNAAFRPNGATSRVSGRTTFPPS
jgi:STE24 endopeptidase